MMEKKKIWVLIPAAVLILAAAVWAFWDALVMYVAPQIPLSRAIQSAVVSLEARFQASPLPILLRGYDESGRNTVEAELTDNGVPVGRLRIQSDLKKNQMLIQGSFPEGSRLPSLDLYLNRDFAALTSETLLQGGYYGITYETFPQDLRSIPLVSLLISEPLKGEWEASVRDLQEKMNREISLPKIPEINIEQLKPALLGLWALRPEIKVVDLYEEWESREQPCWQVTYQVKGETAKFLWEKVLKAPYTGNEEIRLVFYLHQDALVQLKLYTTIGDMLSEYTLTLGQDPRQDDLYLTTAQAHIARSSRKLQTISLTTTTEGETIRTGDKAYTYSWNSQTGDLSLTLPEKKPISMNLSESENGFHVQNAQLGSLMTKNLFTDCTWDVTVTKGASITQPPYQNLDQWSFQDLMILLNGVWSVFKTAA